ncbi:hypothetical protein TNCV_4690531 [Trichonephila clavipes]|nr:hypothetical protein TNCV_4690531 [Trichonephila clavipes]
MLLYSKAVGLVLNRAAEYKKSSFGRTSIHFRGTKGVKPYHANHVSSSSRPLTGLDSACHTEPITQPSDTFSEPVRMG